MIVNNPLFLLESKGVIGSRQRASKTNPAPSKELNPYWVTGWG